MEEFSEGLRQMAGVFLSEETLEAVLGLVVSLAVANLSRADGVSVSLHRRGQFDTSNAVPDVLGEVDAAQYRWRAGPCVDATDSGMVVDAILAEEHTRWPHFVEAAQAHGFASVLSTPLLLPNRAPGGAMNVYSHRREHFSDDEHQRAAIFAQYASVVLANASAYASSEHENEQLHIALTTRERIGQAQGVLMARHGLSSDDAFA
ncbi:MAG: GAF and ANTAR domain-containing protein, partial [Actinobacteria bacterium]|nr:GAF and ANTAR domain-containing protein [Actinomycetota bacterium]